MSSGMSLSFELVAARELVLAFLRLLNEHFSSISLTSSSEMSFFKNPATLRISLVGFYQNNINHTLVFLLKLYTISLC